MVKINMAVEATSHEELLEALKNAGPNVTSFYGEVVKEAPKGCSFQGCDNAAPAEDGSKPEDDVPPVGDPVPEPVPVYSKDEVRSELRKVLQTQGSDAMKDILRKYGSEKLDGVDAKHYADIVADVQKVLADAG